MKNRGVMRDMQIIVYASDRTATSQLESILKDYFPHNISVVSVVNLASLIKRIQTGKLSYQPDILIMELRGEEPNQKEKEIIALTQTSNPNAKLIFVEKTFTKAEIQEKISAATEDLRKADESCILLTSASVALRIDPREVLYVESKKHYLTFYEMFQSQVFRMKLDECHGMLPDDFIRVHQSFLVNAKFIRSFKKETIELVDGRVIPVSRRKYKEAREKFLSQAVK